MNFRITNGAQWCDTTGNRIQAHSGGMLVEAGIYYWYGTHMGDGPAGNLGEVGIVLYRSTDLMRWEPLGTILPVSSDPQHDLYRGLRMERPKIVRHPDGRYVMYFHWVPSGCGHEIGETAVAEARHMTGPWRYLGHFRPDGWDSRDQTLFQDRDGVVYHYYASGQGLRSNATLNVGILTSDYRRPSSVWTRLFPERYMEAPVIVVVDGVYYMLASGCSGWHPNRGRAARATHPFGPWIETGDPCSPHRVEDASVMYRSQPGHAFELHDRPGCWVLMADRWQPQDHALSMPIWLPIMIRNGRAELDWHDDWGVAVFDLQLT